MLTCDAGFGPVLGVLCDALPFGSVSHHLRRGPSRWMGELVDGVEYLLPHLLRDPGSLLSDAGVAQDFETSSSVRDVSFLTSPSSSRWSRRSSCRLSPRCAVAKVFLERASDMSFSLPAMWWKVQSNSEMAESCCCCRLEHGSVFFVKACTKGRWSVWIRNGRPSRRCLNCRVSRWTARSSLSKVEYLVQCWIVSCRRR